MLIKAVAYSFYGHGEVWEMTGYAESVYIFCWAFVLKVYGRGARASGNRLEAWHDGAVSVWRVAVPARLGALRQGSSWRFQNAGCVLLVGRMGSA